MKSKYIQQIDNCIKDRWLSTVSGGYMEEFEIESAKLFGNTYGVSTCNGTSALYLALFCLSLESDNKEVIIPAYGFNVSLSVICSFGLKPVFCDVDLDSYTLDFKECAKLITDDTLAVMVLQPWGNIANLDEMSKLREKHKVYFVSDSSHAHEANWDGKAIGSFFDINCASFGLGKNISGGELGILTTDNLIFRDRALLYSHTNRVPTDLKTEAYQDISNNVGIKFRPHLFALLIALDDLKYNKDKRLTIKNSILNFQKDISSLSRGFKFQKSYKKTDRVFYMPLVELPKSIDRNKLIDKLVKEGYNAQVHNYKTPLNKDSILTDFYGIKEKGDYKNTNKIIEKNIIQLYASDFSSKTRVKRLIEILFSLD